MRGNFLLIRMRTSVISLHVNLAFVNYKKEHQRVNENIFFSPIRHKRYVKEAFVQ